MDVVITNQLTFERKVFRQLDSQVAAALVATGLAAPYNPAVAAAPVSPWGIRLGEKASHPAITYKRGATELWFDGVPQRISEFRPYGDNVPEAIAARYTELWNANGGMIYTADDIALLQTLRAKEPAREKQVWE